MPQNILVYYPDSSTYQTVMKSDVKILFSVDIGCSTCLTKFNYWEDFLERFKSKYGKVFPVMAVIITSKCDEATQEYIHKLWKHEWMCDPDGDFLFDNNLVDDRFQAVMLDAGDTIRLVGNPTFNEALGKLYEKAIIERLP